MSMHEFEDLVEFSVRLLDRSPEAGLDRRSLFKALYDFQAGWDTGYTHFRVIGALRRHRFVYVLPVEDSRQVSKLVERYEGGFVADPIAEFGNDDGQFPAELAGLHLYCDAGSELWQHFVDSGKFVGPDAVAPAHIPIEQAAAIVAREAERREDRNLVCGWLTLLFYELINEDHDLAAIQANAWVAELRAIAKRLAVLSIESPRYHWHIPTRDKDVMEDLEDDARAIAEWWFAL